MLLSQKSLSAEVSEPVAIQAYHQPCRVPKHLPSNRLQIIKNFLLSLQHPEQLVDNNPLYFFCVAEPQIEQPVPAQAEGHNVDDEEITKGRLILYSCHKILRGYHCCLLVGSFHLRPLPVVRMLNRIFSMNFIICSLLRMLLRLIMILRRHYLEVKNSSERIRIP